MYQKGNQLFLWQVLLGIFFLIFLTGASVSCKPDKNKSEDKQRINNYCTKNPIKSVTNSFTSQKVKDLSLGYDFFIQYAKDHSAAYRSLKQLCESFEHRMTGTLNGQRAEQFVFEKLQSYGYDVRYQSFAVNVWQRKRVHFAIQPLAKHNTTKDSMSNADKKPLPGIQINAISFGYTPVRSRDQAEIVDLGNGLASDFAKNKQRIKDRIALVNLSIMGPMRWLVKNPHRVQKTRWAMDHGARAVVYVSYHAEPILSTGTVSEDDSLVDVANIGITRADGKRIRSLLKKGPVLAMLEVDNEYKKGFARNIIATLPGQSKERILVGAHLDTWDVGPGAIDNGIGAATVLDTARAFALSRLRARRTIQFIFWSGEEIGQRGSHFFMNQERKKGNPNNIKYYINIDMHANPVGFDVEGRPEAKRYFYDFGRRLNQMGVSFENRQQNIVSTATDTVPFLLQGIPTVQMMGRMHSNAYKYYHSKDDTFSLVDEYHLRKNNFVITNLVWNLANTMHLPALKLNALQTENWLHRHKMGRFLNQ